MQILNAPPRDNLSADAVRALLTCDDLTVSAGCELLDTSNAFVADISDDFAGGSISFDNRDAIHASCRLQVQRELAWGRDRLRPYMILSGGSTSARFNLGVYVMTTPDTKRGEDPATYDVTGYDLAHLLQNGPADTYEVTAGTTYLQAARDVLTASGIGATLLVDGTRQSTTLPATMVWALTDTGPSWLRILTDLFAAIGYDAPWFDPDGNLRSGPFMDPAVKPVDWTLDTSDDATNIVGEDRTLSVETGDIANWWRFVQTNRGTDKPPPTEGDGIYTTENKSEGATSQAALGRTVRKFVRLDAADQATLVAQGDKIVAQDKGAVRTVSLSVDPLPLMWHGDTFLLIDGGTSEKLAAASWSLNFDGSPGPLQLGGAPPEPVDPVEQQATATVTQAAELRVVVDGATVSSFANALDAATYQVGQRVTVTVRNPKPPLINGQES